MMRRMLAVLHARNLEFVRDRSSLGWNILLPMVLVIGLAVIFGGPERPLFKVAVLSPQGTPLDGSTHPFLAIRYIEFLPVTDERDAIRKVGRHQLDMLIQVGPIQRYWVNPDSPDGYVLERVLLSTDPSGIERAVVSGEAVRYVDWLLPGILGMNMMFSCLFGVGYVVVRYRKNRYLKRLQATPLRAIEFIGAQIVSRLMLIMTVTVFVYICTSLLIGFRMEGSHLLLLLIAALGACAMVALGLLVAARVNSEELAGGVLNMISWPMMLLSGVWFSMEGTHPLLQQGARLLPLTPLLEASRAIMLDGAGWEQVLPQMLTLALMAALFLAAGAALFRWRSD